MKPFLITQIESLDTGKVPSDEQSRWNTMGFPGMIIDFCGTVDTDGHPIPKGRTFSLTNWHICDGTPDLRGRVTIGAGDTYTNLAIGGKDTISPTISISEATQQTTIKEATQNTSIASSIQQTTIAEVAQATTIDASTQLTSIAEATQNTSIAAAAQGTSIGATTLDANYIPNIQATWSTADMGSAEYPTGVCSAYNNFGQSVGGGTSGWDYRVQMNFGSSWAHGHSVNNPAHNHGITNPAHNHTITNPSHTHTITNPTHNHTITNPEHNHTITNPAHTHELTNPAHNHTITIADIDLRQSYCACFKIMRIA